MLLTSFALAGAMLGDFEGLGPWRILAESERMTVAVQIEESTPAPNLRLTAHVLTTFAEPQTLRNGARYRQTLTEIYITCPRAEHMGYFSETWSDIAEPRQPRPADRITPPSVLRGFDYEPLGPLALSICNSKGAEGATVEGDWATVLTTLLARSDSRRP